MSSLVAAIVAVIGLGITVAAVFGSFRVARNTQTTSLYRETALAWEAKARAQESEINDLQQRDQEKDAQIATLKAEKDREVADLRGRIAVLQDTVTGRPLLEAIGTKLDTGLSRIEDIHGEVRELREDIAVLKRQSAA